MPRPSDVSAIVVTRGDVELFDIQASLRLVFDDIIIWNNSERRNLATFGRYEAIAEAKHQVVFVQDDDVVIPAASLETLLDAYEPGKVATNMPARFRPHYPDSGLVGFGAVFDAALPEQAFARWRTMFPEDDLFRRRCDRVFTLLTPLVLLDLPYEEMPWAHAPNRSWKQHGHVAERERVLAMARQVRDEVPAIAKSSTSFSDDPHRAAIPADEPEEPPEASAGPGEEADRSDGEGPAAEATAEAPAQTPNIRRGTGKVHLLATRGDSGDETVCGLTLRGGSDTEDEVTCQRCLALMS
jgi:hypothetical protein